MNSYRISVKVAWVKCGKLAIHVSTAFSPSNSRRKNSPNAPSAKRAPWPLNHPNIDYLEGRKDIDQTKMAILWLQPRWRDSAGVPGDGGAIQSHDPSGGLWFQRALPEVDGTNFVTRVKMPVLIAQRAV